MSWETPHRDVGSPTGPLRRSLPATTYHQELFKCYLTQQCACFPDYAFLSKIVHETSKSYYVEICFLCFAPFLISGFWEEGKSMGKREEFPCFRLLCFSVTHPLAHFRTGRAGGFSYVMGDTAQSRMRAYRPTATLTACNDIFSSIYGSSLRPVCAYAYIESNFF